MLLIVIGSNSMEGGIPLEMSQLSALKYMSLGKCLNWKQLEVIVNFTA